MVVYHTAASASQCVCGHYRSEHRARDSRDEWYECHAGFCGCAQFDPTPAAPDQAEGPPLTPEDAMRADVAIYLSEVERLRASLPAGTQLRLDQLAIDVVRRAEIARLRAREIL